MSGRCFHPHWDLLAISHAGLDRAQRVDVEALKPLDWAHANGQQSAPGSLISNSEGGGGSTSCSRITAHPDSQPALFYQGRSTLTPPGLQPRLNFAWPSQGSRCLSRYGPPHSSLLPSSLEVVQKGVLAPSLCDVSAAATRREEEQNFFSLLPLSVCLLHHLTRPLRRHLPFFSVALQVWISFNSSRVGRPAQQQSLFWRLGGGVFSDGQAQQPS
ncbi:hypothetical protein NDU88_003162 [Pleurodeles waltl]|uniref:Uncharacterized protein n=1 Tax=Pleurodeles waltl TaxID=8319 RepID=A0AAV7UZD5_PLEWA|nr:hypothetical protein NDU88_003162 [Pleurodeles waltl]